MPCYSKILTVLLDMSSIEKAATLLGITIEKHSANRYTLRKNGEYITISRESATSKFSTEVYSGSNNFETEILQPLTFNYAKIQVKKFGEKNGYTVSAGSKPGELVLTSYK